MCACLNPQNPSNAYLETRLDQSPDTVQTVNTDVDWLQPRVQRVASMATVKLTSKKQVRLPEL